MILIADSGSTKTDWALIDTGDKPQYSQTTGLNPFYINRQEVKEEIRGKIVNGLNTLSVDKLHFYGSGTSTQSKKELLENIFTELFPDAEIVINTDILGAARALFMNTCGIACILGTGSNSCVYDGKEITEIVPSVGFIFGDEGSGSHLGKLLISNYLKNTLPDNIKKAFDKKHNYNKADILDNVYRQPFPNRFLASFSLFLTENISEAFIKNLIKSGFNEFVNYYIKLYNDYRNLPVAFTGSIAYYFQDILNQVFYENDLKISHIIKSPIERLVEYHLMSEVRGLRSEV